MGQPDEGSPPKARALPHYALPNFSVVLPTYSNNESDVITQAFRIGNFCSISALPNSMKPGQVSRSRFQKILDNRQPKEAEQIFGAPYKPKAKTFSEFEYVPSPFNMADELAKEERNASHAAHSAAGHKAPFRMSDTSIKLKYEDSFGDTFNVFRSGADPYERADDQALRFKWLQDAQILCGPFRPSGRVKGQTGQAASEMPSRQSLPAMVEQLREAIEDDWGEYAFLVCSTDDEHLVVRFELSTLDSEPGLVAYMNVFARSAHVISKYQLRKVVEDWNVTPGDGHLYFTFRPPWVTSTVTETYYALHPELRDFQHSRRAAASGKAPSPTEGSGEGFGNSLEADSSAPGTKQLGGSLGGSMEASGADGLLVRPDLS